MRWLFVVMPWHSAHYPSLSVGILKSITEEYDENIHTNVLYANLRWIDFLREKTDGRIDLKEYHVIGEDLIFKGTGEWVFSSALHQKKTWKPEAYRQTPGLSDDHFQLALEQHHLAPEFIREMAEEIVAGQYDYVGFTSTFMQNAACLALAGQIKELAPQIRIIMGGGNCDGSQGMALHRNFHTVDYIVSGEGEAAFRAFLDYCHDQTEIESVPGLIWRDENGSSHRNHSPALSQMCDVPTPNYDEYFEQALASQVADRIELNIVVESARGCWWGQKHHCTFCGLNGTGMTYRLKDSDTFIDELETLVSKYQTLDIITADNIIGMEYFKTVLPKLVERDYDFRIHYEVKANLRFDQLAMLRNAGVSHLQPGIESLSTKILKQMDKGTTGVQNVRVLRDMTELGVTATWNVLAGFPDETKEDYESLLRQLPSLVHIQPPTGIGRIAVERFSPFFNKPELGFEWKRPARFYKIAFDLPEEELVDMVYLFESEQLGITEDHMKYIQSELEGWAEDYRGGSLLTFETSTKGTLIRDKRLGWEPRAYHLISAEEQHLFTALRQPKSRKAVHSLMQKAFPEMKDKQVVKLIEKFRDLGLIFEENDCFVGLPTAQTAIQIRVFGDEEQIMSQLAAE